MSQSLQSRTKSLQNPRITWNYNNDPTKNIYKFYTEQLAVNKGVESKNLRKQCKNNNYNNPKFAE